MEVIRRIARNDSKSVAFTVHAREQMVARSISIRDVFRALEMGDPEGPIEPGDKPGHTKVMVRFQPRGARAMCVVTVLVEPDERLVIVTTMWRDK